jgi:hypothetical protein
MALALWLLVAPANLHAADESKVAADAVASAEWIANALTASGYKADFSLASLREIDRFFDEQAPDGNVLPGGLLGEQLGSRLFAIGSYVGETIRRTRGGEWIGNDKDAKAEITLALKLTDGSLIWPIQRVMKRLRGREDGLAAYGAATGAKPRR